MIDKMFKILNISIVILLIFISCKSNNLSGAMNNWNKIKGKWKSYKGVIFNENWKYVNDSLYAGLGFNTNGDDTVFMEKLTLTCNNDSVYYNVYKSGMNVPVRFLLTYSSSDEWVFENFDHDFPQRIKYYLENDTTLTVLVSDKLENKKQFFYLSRISD